MKDYILGSHNSWSYLSPKHWWMRPFAFMAKCQSIDIKAQYELGVRCFDLRIRTDRYAYPHVCHGMFDYSITPQQLAADLAYLNSQHNCFVRVIHEARTSSQYTPRTINGFVEFCRWAEDKFPDIAFWSGRNLYNYKVDYDFTSTMSDGLPVCDPSCEEKYSSVTSPAYLDDWWPWLYARINNRKIIAQGTDLDILLIDYVNIK